MERVHLSLALAALLVLAGCTGGSGGAAPETVIETTEEATTETAGASTAETTVEQGPQTTDDQLETTAGTENGTLSEKNVFEAYGVAVNYSAEGDLDASAVVRSHLAALEDTERLTASSVSRSETGDRSTVMSVYFQRDGTRFLYRTGGAGVNRTIYRGEEVGVMRTVRDGEATYLLLGEGNDEANATTDPASAFAVQLAKLQLLPYEEVGTVTRNGTTMTKYEATGPGYYSTDELAGDVSVESYTSTVLVGEDGLVRLFHQKVVVERDGETVTKEVTVRHEDVGTATVTEPDWLEDATDRGNTTDGIDRTDGIGSTDGDG